ncbi:MAG TPA: pyridoxamine 5'-phosphate oxidase family protein, partial [Acidimicrobiales bacterium]|nr:pyridoxamine 5'-phosphate oxidase family protein [Acidimicrobiales bacterium]
MNVQDVLNDKVAQELLASKEMASLAYTWRDGTPRAVPIWFQWTGTQVVMCSPVNAPKMKVLESRPEVAVSIYNNTWPYHALYLRGTVKVERFDGIAPELVGISEHYAGPDFANAWISQNRASGLKWARIELAPTYAALIDC